MSNLYCGDVEHAWGPEGTTCEVCDAVELAEALPALVLEVCTCGVHRVGPYNPVLMCSACVLWHRVRHLAEDGQG